MAAFSALSRTAPRAQSCSLKRLVARSRELCWLSLSLLAACGAVDDPTALQLSSAAEGSGAGSGGAGSASDSLWQDPTAAQGLADVAAAEPAPRQGNCRAIDFLFVVDNSFSMEREQSILSRSFPGFMGVIGDQLQALDYHVMVVDTDAMTPGEVVDAEQQGAPDTADEICDGTLGAGRRANRRTGSCQVSADGRFLDGAQGDLAGAFDCIGRVGTAGSSYEQQVGALLGATSSKLTAPGACNRNFLRRDAVLVVTFMTDEDDEVTSGEPAAWRESLLELKGGDESALVLLGLVGDDNRRQPLPGGPCIDGEAHGAPRLQSFVESFRFGSLGAVCAGDYAPFFERAVSVIGNACREFVPPEIR